MAELGIATSVIGIADVALRLGSKLWKVGKDLGVAGKQARDIADQTRLIGEALRRTSHHITAKASPHDALLIQEIAIVCEGRIREAEQLVEGLELERLIGGSNVRSLLIRLKFVFEKSNFALLQNDLNSLQITLNLVLNASSYEQNWSNGQADAALQNELKHLKEIIEQDIQQRHAEGLVQFTMALMTNESSLDAERDGRQATILSSLPNEVSALSNYTGECTELSTANQMVSSHEFSKALVAFAQLQMVQAKTIRKAEQELERPLDLKSPSHDVETRPGANERLSAASTSPQSPAVSKDSQAEKVSRSTAGSASPFDRGIQQKAPQGSHSPDQTARLPKMRDNIISHREHKIMTQEEMLTESSRSPQSLKPGAPNDSSFSNRSFTILDVKGGRHWYRFEDLDTHSLSELIIRVNKKIDSLPPRHAQSLPFMLSHNRDEWCAMNSSYEPPDSSVSAKPRASLLEKLNKKHNFTEAQSRYTIDFALWFTDHMMYRALEQQDYKLFDAQYMLSERANRVQHSYRSEQRWWKQSPVEFADRHDWDDLLRPGCVIAVSFTARNLQNNAMLYIDNEYRFDWVVADSRYTTAVKRMTRNPRRAEAEDNLQDQDYSSAYYSYNGSSISSLA